MFVRGCWRTMCENCGGILAVHAIDDIVAMLRGERIERGIDDPIPFELNMVRSLREDFRKAVAKFMGDGEVRDLLRRMADPAFHITLPDLKRQVSSQVLEAFHAIADSKLGTEFAEAVREVVDAELDAMYLASRTASARTVGLADDAWSVLDANSLRALQQNNLYWIRGNYSRNVRTGIEAGTKEALNQGLGRKALAERLKQTMGRRFAATAGHWETIAAASLNRTRNVSQVRTYELARITRMEIVAVLDRRTTPICVDMNGRVFEVETASRVVTEMTTAANPDDIKALMPWLNWDQDNGHAFAVIRGERVDLPSGRSDADNAAIAAVAPLPPYHGRCRTTTVADVTSIRR